MTTNLRLLGSIGFLTQLTRPGERTVYYRVDDDAWGRVVRRQVASLTALGGILHGGIGLVSGSPEQTARIRAAYEVFGWLDKVFADAPPMPTGDRDGGPATPGAQR